MKAAQFHPATNRYSRPRSSKLSASQRSRRDRHQAIALESTAKFAVILVLFTGAVSALHRILPYALRQQERLGEIQSELAQIEQKVSRLQQAFQRSFDPYQTRTVMEEETNRLGIGKHQLVWLDPESTADGDRPAQVFMPSP